MAQKDNQAVVSDITPAALKEALQVIKNEEDPKNSEEKEAYFMTQVGVGEQLAAQGPCSFLAFTKLFLSLPFVGPSFYLPAAMAFYRALRIYPNPADLLGIYQKTIIEPVFKVSLILPIYFFSFFFPYSMLYTSAYCRND